MMSIIVLLSPSHYLKKIDIKWISGRLEMCKINKTV